MSYKDNDHRGQFLFFGILYCLSGSQSITGSKENKMAGVYSDIKRSIIDTKKTRHEFTTSIKLHAHFCS